MAFFSLERKQIERVLTIEQFSTILVQVYLTPFFLCFQGEDLHFGENKRLNDSTGNY